MGKILFNKTTGNSRGVLKVFLIETLVIPTLLWEKYPKRCCYTENTQEVCLSWFQSFLHLQLPMTFSRLLIHGMWMLMMCINKSWTKSGQPFPKQRSTVLKCRRYHFISTTKFVSSLISQDLMVKMWESLPVKRALQFQNLHAFNRLLKYTTPQQLLSFYNRLLE